MCKDIEVLMHVKNDAKGKNICQMSMHDPGFLDELPEENKIKFVNGYLEGQIAGIRFLNADGSWGTTNLWRSIKFNEPFAGLALIIWATAEPIPGCKHIVVSPTRDLGFPEHISQDECPRLHKYVLKDDGYHLVGQC